MILFYALALASVYVLGIIINALAPTFDSAKNPTNAMKLAVFSMTPSWVAGVLYIAPFLGVLVVLASFYGLYILYLGFTTPLMETPKEKILGYFVVSIVIAFLLMVVVSVVLGAIFTVGAVGGVY